MPLGMALVLKEEDTGVETLDKHCPAILKNLICKLAGIEINKKEKGGGLFGMFKKDKIKKSDSILMNAAGKVRETLDNMLMDLAVQVKVHFCQVLIKSENLNNNYLYVSNTKMMGCNMLYVTDNTNLEHGHKVGKTDNQFLWLWKLIYDNKNPNYPFKLLSINHEDGVLFLQSKKGVTKKTEEYFWCLDPNGMKNLKGVNNTRSNFRLEFEKDKDDHPFRIICE